MVDDEDSKDQRRHPLENNRFWTSTPFTPTKGKSYRQALARHRRMMALRHYSETGDPGPGIRLGLFPPDSKPTVTRHMKLMAKEARERRR